MISMIFDDRITYNLPMNYPRAAVKLAILLTCVWFASCGPMGSDQSSMETGKPAPGIALNTVDGQPWKLSNQKGSVVVLDFWATWCGPCQMSLPNLNRLSSDPSLAGRGLKVVAVNSQESAETVKGFLAANHYTMTVVLDSDGSADRAYQVTNIPTTVVVGRDGVVKYVSVGFDPQTSESMLSAAIERALAEK